MCMRALANQDNQRIVRGTHIIDINSRARHMLVGTVMAARGVDVTGNAAGAIRRSGAGVVHGPLVGHYPASSNAAISATPCGPARRGTAAPVMSIPYFRIRFCATCRR